MVDYVTAKKQFLATHKKLRNYMLNYLDIITTVSSIMLICSGTDENLEKKKSSCGNYIKQKDPFVFFAGCGMGYWAVIPTCRERAAGRSLWRAISSVKGSSNLIRAAPWRKKKASRRGSPCGPLPEAVRASGRCWQRLLFETMEMRLKICGRLS